MTDQHFLLNIPTEGPGECIRIMGIEEGSISKLTEELVSMVPGLQSGSVIMLGSASQLAVDSTEFYTAEWKTCWNLLREKLGEIIVITAILSFSPV